MAHDFCSLDNKQVLTAAMSIAEYISGTRTIFSGTRDIPGQSAEQFKLTMVHDLIVHCDELKKRGIIDHKLATVGLVDVAMTIKSEINRTHDAAWIEALEAVASCLYTQSNKPEALANLCTTSAHIGSEKLEHKKAILARISEYLGGVQSILGVQKAVSLAIQHATSASFGSKADQMLVDHIASWLTKTLALHPAERAVVCLTVRPTAPAAIKKSLEELKHTDKPTVALAG